MTSYLDHLPDNALGTALSTLSCRDLVNAYDSNDRVAVYCQQTGLLRQRVTAQTGLDVSHCDDATVARIAGYANNRSQRFPLYRNVLH